MKFKDQDIVVVENGIDGLPINSVVKIEEYCGLPLLIIRTFRKNTFQILSIFLGKGKLRKEHRKFF